MAKRFTDTGLGRKKWFRQLSPAFKCAWRFLTEECDCAGAWSIDEDTLEFHIGEHIPLDEFIGAVNADGEVRIRYLGKDKLFLPDFISFQYGRLSSACKPHLKVIERLKELTLWEGYAKGLERVEEEEEYIEEEKEKEIQGGVGGKIPVPPPPPKNPKLDQSEIKNCLDDWRATLKHFEKERSLIPGEDVQIAAACQRYGIANVLLAFKGARQEPKGKDYDPSNFVSLDRYLDPKKFKRFVSLGIGDKGSADSEIDIAAIRAKRSGAA